MASDSMVRGTTNLADFSLHELGGCVDKVWVGCFEQPMADIGNLAVIITFAAKKLEIVSNVLVVGLKTFPLNTILN